VVVVLMVGLVEMVVVAMVEPMDLLVPEQ